MTYAEIAGLGTPESTWANWSGLAELRETTAQDLVPAGARALVIAPHPDDEVLGTGGILAALSGRRTELLLFAVTDGTASHPGSATWTPAALAAARPRETLAALEALGVDAEVLRLGLPDGDVASYEDLLTRHLTESLQAGDVVFATWRHDAHPDHEAVGRAAAAACQAAGATLLEVPIWMWHWAVPGDERVPWRRVARVPMTAGTHERKQAAVAAYISQVSPDPALAIGAVLPQPVLDRLLRPFEVVLL